MTKEELKDKYIKLLEDQNEELKTQLSDERGRRIAKELLSLKRKKGV